MGPSPEKMDFALGSSLVYWYPPTSVIRPVMAPSCMVTRTVPSGTITLLPLVMMLALPLVLDPRPLFVPMGIPGKTPAVGDTSCPGP